MKKNDLHKLFIDELKDMYNSENQILKALPKMIKLAASPELKTALAKHYRETEYQVNRIEEIFAILELPAKEKKCAAMKGLLDEANAIVKGKSKSALLDAAIISATQKVEHYEIASYGTLRSFANTLGYDDKIIQLLQETLDEEGHADKKLTTIADGSFLNSGVNKKATKAA